MVAALDEEEETPESNLADAKQLQDDHHQVLQKSSLVAAASPVQRQKNLGSRVALLPGKFLRVRKVFARINEKTF